jgi:hypothetical protein
MPYDIAMYRDTVLFAVAVGLFVLLVRVDRKRRYHLTSAEWLRRMRELGLGCK